MAPSSKEFGKKQRRSNRPSNTHIVQRALHKGGRASHVFKHNFRKPNVGGRLVTTNRHVEGVCQDFVLHGTSPVSDF